MAAQLADCREGLSSISKLSTLIQYLKVFRHELKGLGSGWNSGPSCNSVFKCKNVLVTEIHCQLVEYYGEDDMSLQIVAK
jgi:hypothetical protein